MHRAPKFQLGKPGRCFASVTAAFQPFSFSSDHHRFAVVAPVAGAGGTDRIELHVVDLTRGQTVKRVPGRGALDLFDEHARRGRQRDSPIVGVLRTAPDLLADIAEPPQIR
jgi:hypothetical protein